MSIPFEITDWQGVEKEVHPGETGVATWQSKLYNSLRVRLVSYSAGYKADHWCSKGHIVYCLEGEFISQLKDGSTHQLSKGMSYQCSDDSENPHRSISEKGCVLFIVDGDFLKAKS
jgi:hypothetical protein